MASSVRKIRSKQVNRIMLLTKGKEGYLQEIDMYTANEVQHTSKLFHSMLDLNRELDESIMKQMIAMRIQIKGRAQVMMRSSRILVTMSHFVTIV
jgi:hypothetical protein